MVTYTKPKDRKKEGDRLTGERDKTTFVDHRFEGKTVSPRYDINTIGSFLLEIKRYQFVTDNQTLLNWR